MTRTLLVGTGPKHSVDNIPRDADRPRHPTSTVAEWVRENLPSAFDLDSAFAQEADESAGIARSTFDASAETWPEG
ncbi:MAG: hypothetical protein WCP28_06620 [Actinomycetes bacterium]